MTVRNNKGQFVREVPTRITNHETGEVTVLNGRESIEQPVRFTNIVEKPKAMALTPEQIAASNANLAAIRDGVMKAAAGQKPDVTPDPEEEPADFVTADQQQVWNETSIIKAGEPIKAPTQPKRQPWSQKFADFVILCGWVVLFLIIVDVGIVGCVGFVFSVDLLNQSKTWHDQ